MDFGLNDSSRIASLVRRRRTRHAPWVFGPMIPSTRNFDLKINDGRVVVLRVNNSVTSIQRRSSGPLSAPCRLGLERQAARNKAAEVKTEITVVAATTLIDLGFHFRQSYSRYFVRSSPCRPRASSGLCPQRAGSSRLRRPLGRHLWLFYLESTGESDASQSRRHLSRSGRNHRAFRAWKRPWCRPCGLWQRR